MTKSLTAFQKNRMEGIDKSACMHCAEKHSHALASPCVPEGVGNEPIVSSDLQRDLSHLTAVPTAQGVGSARPRPPRRTGRVAKPRSFVPVSRDAGDFACCILRMSNPPGSGHPSEMQVAAAGQKSTNSSGFCLAFPRHIHMVEMHCQAGHCMQLGECIRSSGCILMWNLPMRMTAAAGWCAASGVSPFCSRQRRCPVWSPARRALQDWDSRNDCDFTAAACLL